mmetsp:Transcript_40023/g.132430  ORF Transcript_40023/g.132430 Transcript_40023/m.132430 type:complete len:226 (+) Transcript_40023:1063-1740(+)
MMMEPSSLWTLFTSCDSRPSTRASRPSEVSSRWFCASSEPPNASMRYWRYSSLSARCSNLPLSDVAATSASTPSALCGVSTRAASAKSTRLSTSDETAPPMPLSPLLSPFCASFCASCSASSARVPNSHILACASSTKSACAVSGERTIRSRSVSRPDQYSSGMAPALPMTCLTDVRYALAHACSCTAYTASSSMPRKARRPLSCSLCSSLRMAPFSTMPDRRAE